MFCILQKGGGTMFWLGCLAGFFLCFALIAVIVALIAGKEKKLDEDSFPKK